MIIFPVAKINIGLQILSKRNDGFRNIYTFFYPFNDLKDILEIVESKSGQTNIFISGIDLEGNSRDNLCIKAYNLLSKEYDLPPVDIYLHKNIPVGAGLGGGSSDAASTLILLNKMFNLNICNENLKKIAGMLGSDCTFFIDSKPAFASSRGEVLEEVDFNLNKKIIVKTPDIHISTKEAYSLVTPNPDVPDLKTLVFDDIKTWRANIKNDFEEVIFPLYPEIAMIKEEMYANGAIYASMSGSGSAVYGIFE
ncbi:MAG: 4-(cytidine 5'-diphospho)-2-C-methyl-D-erythritol kinase [Bacteroidales bacterium]|jgi:4-diphosphocytidyl-2-C-methyl-D-erythritol kinase|nr:4-(cytidine 5'-diphospho)-2-C-methyl-D-erythritol kinase [Bacteroidales bacterium]